MKILSVAMLILFLGLFGVYAEETLAVEKFSKYLGSELKSRLSLKNEASAMFKEKQAPQLLPKVSAESRIRADLSKMNVTFGVEICTIHQFKNKTDTNEKRRAIYNLILSVRSLEGIQYYSASRKRMREFIHKSFRIASAEDRTPLPDIRGSEIIPERTIYTFQHDSSFGENTYQVTYRTGTDYFLMEMKNMSQVWYGIIPIVDPGNLRYYILAIPKDDCILFYSMICVSGANPFGIMEGKAESFSNRIKALETWFLDNYKD